MKPIRSVLVAAVLISTIAGVQAQSFTNLSAGQARIVTGKSLSPVALNPQPIPPGEKFSLNPQPIPPGERVGLNPQPIPPKEAPKVFR